MLRSCCLKIMFKWFHRMRKAVTEPQCNRLEKARHAFVFGNRRRDTFTDTMKWKPICCRGVNFPFKVLVGGLGKNILGLHFTSQVMQCYSWAHSYLQRPRWLVVIKDKRNGHWIWGLLSAKLFSRHGLKSDYWGIKREERMSDGDFCKIFSSLTYSVARHVNNIMRFTTKFILNSEFVKERPREEQPQG